MIFRVILLFFLGFTAGISAAVKVVTSTTDISWLAKEIGGNEVEVSSLLKGTENPHYVDTVPEFIRLTAEAQLVCVVGLDLEVGWMPKVLAKSGNAQAQPGGKGYCELGKVIQPLERSNSSVDRSMGDVHPMGNPHFWLSPKYFAQSAGELLAALIRVDPAHAPLYGKRAQELKQKLDEAVIKNRKKLASKLSNHTGPVLLEYHKEFSYFLETYGLESLGSIEEKPGVPPSAGRIAEVAMAAKAAGVKFVLAADYSPQKVLMRFTELSQIPVVIVPTSLQPAKRLTDYLQFQDVLIDAILARL